MATHIRGVQERLPVGWIGGLSVEWSIEHCSMGMKLESLLCDDDSRLDRV